MDTEAWRAAVHGVMKNQTRLNWSDETETGSQTQGENRFVTAEGEGGIEGLGLADANYYIQDG